MRVAYLLTIWFIFTNGLFAFSQTLPSELVTINNKQISLNELQSKTVVLNYWFITCGPCLKELGQLKELSTKYKNSKDVLFISISSMDDAEQLRFFKKYKDFGYQLIPKNDQWIEAFGVTLFPTNVIVHKGKKIFEKSGYDEKIGEKLEDALVELIRK